MTNNVPPHEAADPLDEIVEELLQCGGVLSQMIAGMVEFESSGRSASDTAPIPEVAHDLIRSVSLHVPRRYSKRDLRTAAKIVKEITNAICEDIYVIPPEEFDRLLAADPDGDSD